MSNWTTIESDVGVFTELIETFGVKNVQVEELFGLDEELFSRLQPVYGLVFLFKWTGERDERPCRDPAPDTVYFAKQVVSNACATQALLSVLLNREDIDIGPALRDFREFTTSFPPQLRGEAIGNSDMIRVAHNGFARPEPFVAEGDRHAKEEEDAYHFVSYVPVYELDGLREGPILLGEFDAARDWIAVVRAAIEARIQRYSSAEIRFNLMALVQDRRIRLVAGAGDADARVASLRAACEAAPSDSAAAAELCDAEAAAAAAREELNEELERRQGWAVENARRKHNWLPMAVELMRGLAEKGRLAELIEAGKRRAESLRRSQNERKRAREDDGKGAS